MKIEATAQLRAEFVLNNRTSLKLKVASAFPIGAFTSMDLDETKDYEPATVGEYLISVNKEIQESRKASGLLYLADLYLNPGDNLVEVLAPVPFTQIKAEPFVVQLDYCIRTGSAWAGSIGVEDVLVEFPTTDHMSIISSSPAGSFHQGNTLRWRFSNFEPKGSEYDISIRFIEPRVSGELERLKKLYLKDQTSRENLLRYADFLLFLGVGKRHSELPYSLPEEWIARNLSAFTSELQTKLKREGSNASLNDLRMRDLRLLDIEVCEVQEALFRDKIVREGLLEKYVVEGMLLLESWLSAHPKDSIAWKLYLNRLDSAYHLFDSQTIGGKPTLFRRKIVAAWNLTTGDARLKTFFDRAGLESKVSEQLENTYPAIDFVDYSSESSFPNLP